MTPTTCRYEPVGNLTNHFWCQAEQTHAWRKIAAAAYSWDRLRNLPLLLLPNPWRSQELQSDCRDTVQCATRSTPKHFQLSRARPTCSFRQDASQRERELFLERLRLFAAIAAPREIDRRSIRFGPRIPIRLQSASDN